jgi:hypothetical protein
MSVLCQYQRKYRNIAFERRDAVLEDSVHA